ncbi:YceD family protein [Sinisalibacter aestuarii]|uniref:DUF177 domain-containing protein n=1 Tax=Sinisalibacter aestuarii TaxID=2949426 RepID=A0ABQ5LRD5_9RHOB|nr:DUF177 domain-containing protein [Sinisalibacter aestuarii]GKY87575.1 hypothetical protein STA1M1_14440 [Sinisalibacter aestuarii]
MSASHKSAAPGPVIRVADLAKGETRPILVEPDAEARAAIAALLGIDAVKKLRFEGTLGPLGKRDWRLTGQLGATVVQPCVVTLAPVTTRIEETVERAWIADWQEPQSDEVELPESVDDEPLGTEIDIGTVMVEALALALPAFPRAEGAELDETVFTEPGKAAMTDEDARPFAGLAALRDKLAGEGED